MSEAFSKLGGKELYAEAWADFVKELAVMVRGYSCDERDAYIHSIMHP